MISSKLAQQNVGYPLLDTPEAKASLEASVAQRMQNKPRPAGRLIDGAKARKARIHRRHDQLRRSPFNQYLWDWGLGLEAAKLVLVARRLMVATTSLLPLGSATSHPSSWLSWVVGGHGDWSLRRVQSWMKTTRSLVVARLTRAVVACGVKA